MIVTRHLLPPPKLKYGVKDITGPVDIANNFNEFLIIVKMYLLVTDDKSSPPAHENLKLL